MSELSTITLPGTSISTTVLGFGCNGLLGDKSREQGAALLSAAYDAGVRHFDTARYYGYGDAEVLLGEMARGKRDTLSITTKFGMQPMKAVSSSPGLVGMARRLMRLSPAFTNLVRRKIVGNLVQHGQFDVASARQSLETSLRALNTDYIDVLLLHEAAPPDCHNPELLAFLHDAQAQGKIRAFGIGSAWERTCLICEQSPAFSAVAQFESTWQMPNARTVFRAEARLPAGVRAVITHGGLAALGILRERLSADAALQARASQVLGADCAAPYTLSTALLLLAIAENPQGVVLFRASTPERIVQNAQAAARSPFTQEQLEKFRALL